MASQWLELTGEFRTQAKRDNAALLQILEEHGLLWSKDTPKSLLRRLVQEYYSQKVIFDSVRNELALLPPRGNFQPLFVKLKWLSSVPCVAEWSIFRPVDLAAQLDCVPGYDSDTEDDWDDDLPGHLKELDESILRIVSKYYYDNREGPKAWYSGPYIKHVRSASVRWLEDERCGCFPWDKIWHYRLDKGPKECPFLPKVRQHMSKCHTHYVGFILANVICRNCLNNDLIENVHHYIMSEGEVKPVVV